MAESEQVFLLLSEQVCSNDRVRARVKSSNERAGGDSERESLRGAGKTAPPKSVEWTGTQRDAFPLTRLPAWGRGWRGASCVDNGGRHGRLGYLGKACGNASATR